MVGKRRSSSRGGINLSTARKEKVSFSEQLVSQPLRKRVRRSATDILLADYNANTSASLISPINISSHQPSSLTSENSTSQLPLSALQLPLSSTQLDSLVSVIVNKVCDVLEDKQSRQNTIASTPSSQNANPNTSTLQDALAKITADITTGQPNVSSQPVGADSYLQHLGILDTSSHFSNNHDAIPLGTSVPASLRGKILANEYIPFGQLLNPVSSSDYTVNIVNNTMQLNLQQRSKGIFNIDMWSQAFAIYCTIYLEGHSDQAIPLIKYGYNIREMARQYPLYAWRNYDEAFRQARSVTGWPWDIISNELYIKSVSQALANNTTQRFNNNSGSSTQSARPFFRRPSQWSRRPRFTNAGPQRNTSRPQYDESGRAPSVINGLSTIERNDNTHKPVVSNNNTNPNMRSSIFTGRIQKP